ncbi:Undecaprenyl-phosphate mannosyltransferase [subsurface metagenome]
MKLSVIVPVFNEKRTIEEVLRRIKNVEIKKEIIVVDDYSTDGTREILERISDKGTKVIFHSQNKGKGAAIKTAQMHISGDVVIIQDADLEYQPEDYLNLIKPIKAGLADVVYGSRFLGVHRFSSFRQYSGNKFLTWMTNVLYRARLTDMETCYKVFKAPIFLNLDIKAKRFDFEPEITAKILRTNLRVVEVPITYHGRSSKKGKKITWKDGLVALWTLLKYRFVD